MILSSYTISRYLNSSYTLLPPILNTRVGVFLLQLASISNLKVIWRKDRELDQAIVNDKKWRLCSRVVKEVLNEPNQVIPLRYLQKRIERLKLNVNAKTFIKQNPCLFEIYLDRIKPKTELVPFIRPTDRLHRFLEKKELVYLRNESLIVEKLCKLLMMTKDKVISTDKLAHVKRVFGLPNDFLQNLVPKYSNYFKVVGCLGVEGKSWLELVSCEPEFSKSVILKRAEEEERLTGIRARPSFNWELPPGFSIKKEMREWVRNWVERPYVSPYDDASGLDPASPDMEKRMIGVLHELLSLSLLKRVAVPILGKFGEEYRLSNGFSSAFTRHSGLFYVSLKGGIETAFLREAYKGDVLMDRDPLLEIKDMFVELLEEGWREWKEESSLSREAIQKDIELMTAEKDGVKFSRIRTNFECKN